MNEGGAGAALQPAEVDLARRFGGVDRLYGPSAAARLRDATVAVVGIGGVGSWAVEALARSGVGNLVLVDLDIVSESNINRQIHALGSTVGQAKVLAMQQRVADINPSCAVHAVDDFAEAGNWPGLLPVAVDAAIDACDDARAKVVLAAWALRQRVPFITVGAAGGKRHAQRVEIDDLVRATHDPLLAKLRYQLRREHGAPHDGKPIGLACVFSREPVAPPDSACAVQGDGSLNCAGYGSAVSVTATFGLCAAGWVVDRLGAQPRRL